MLRQDYPLLQQHPHLIYLDSSSTTQKPAVVLAALENFYRKNNANVHRGTYQLSQKATLDYEEARETVAKFIGAKFSEIIFTKGTTKGLNLLAYSLGHNLMPGDEIVLTVMEHHSNIVPWQQLAKRKGLTIKYISITADYRLNMEEAKQMISSKTKIVSVTHLSNVLGTINPVKELVYLAHKVGAVMIVDAAQTASSLNLQVKELGCDFLAFSGHKMGGPTGIGVLYGREELLAGMEPFLAGGDMIKEVTFESAQWNDLPYKFEAGTPPIAQAIGLAAAIKYLQQIGMTEIKRHLDNLTSHALDKISAIKGVNIIGPNEAVNRGSIFSFTVNSDKGIIHPHDLAESLDQAGIAVRAGYHCAMPLINSLGLSGTIRASFYLYNSTEEIDKLVEVIEEIVAASVKGYELSGDLSEEQEICRENVLDHYKNPHNNGKLEIYTFSHRELNPVCGDEITLYLNLAEDRISEISFTGRGCVISQAAASLFTDEIKGRCRDEINNFTPEEVLKLLGIPISPARIKCALLPLFTLQKMLAENTI